MKNKLLITVPWPPRTLSPNSRVHWAVKHRSSKECRRSAYFIAKESLSKSVIVGDNLSVSIFAYPKDKRKRDLDNLIASLKPVLDGIADAIGVDDSKFALNQIKMMPSDKNNRIEIILKSED